MAKTLKFRSHLIPAVLDGSKTVTWRLFDDKGLRAGDELELIDWGSGKTFARAMATRVTKKPFAELTDADREGHEAFDSEAEMYETYSNYYGQPVTPDTVVKIITFSMGRDG